jgi:outer membrane immunogenic protein
MQKIALICLALAPFSNALAAEGFSGLYAGIHAGYVDVDADGKEYFNGAPSGWAHDLSPDGGLIGGFLGFNKVLENNVLLGIEADYEFRDATDKNAEKFNGVTDNGFTSKARMEDAASLRARLGYVFNDSRTLAYVTAGYATAKVKTTYKNFLGNTDSNTKWHDGWVLGAGAEHFFTDNIAARAEYRYADYGDEKSNIDLPGYARYRQNLEDEQSIRVGVIYHF